MSGGDMNQWLQLQIEQLRQRICPAFRELRDELYEDFCEVDTDYKNAHQTVEALRQLIIAAIENEETVHLDDVLVEKLQRFDVAKAVPAQESSGESDDQLSADIERLQLSDSFILTRDDVTETSSNHGSQYFKNSIQQYEAVPVEEYQQKFKIKIPYYDPSDAVKQAQSSNFTDADFCNFMKLSVVHPGNIIKIYKTLLEIEDLFCMSKYPALALKSVKIQRIDNANYWFEVPHSTERPPINNAITSFMDEVVIVPRQSTLSSQPSKSPVDILAVHPHESINDQLLRRRVAPVSSVTSNAVYFQIRKGGALNVDEDYDVIFRPMRIPYRFQHRALEMLAEQPRLQHYLFPIWNPQRQQQAATIKLNLFNDEINRNPEQLQAVQNVVEGTNSFAPYIIFGPPGTGKTTTIVEAILQLRLTKPQSRIIVTAGSNSACDTIALRICKYLNSNLAAARRLYHFNYGAPGYMPIIRVFSQSILQRKMCDLHPDLLRISNVNMGEYHYPLVKYLRRFGIIVATLCTAGKLINGGINEEKPHFTHIFIDEAGASTELEALVGIVGIKKGNDNCRVILSGDHKQLGPVIKSTRAEELGLGRSLMERLINRRCYWLDANGKYDVTLQTRLRRNYRSHAEIVRLYNHLYYDNKLLASARREDVDRYSHFSLLANPTFPIIFQAVHGTTVQDPASKSCYNLLEIEVLIWTIRKLLSEGIPGRPPIQLSDIGVISPYKSQYLRIQEELRSEGYSRVETGSAEMFQGREKPIIFVSFVRSFTKLGFVSCPRRLNVILSRAKSLLILIGNPVTLRHNDDFKFIINECKRHGTLRRKVQIKYYPDPLDKYKKIRTCSLASSASTSMSSLVDEVEEGSATDNKFLEAIDSIAAKEKLNEVLTSAVNYFKNTFNNSLPKTLEAMTVEENVAEDVQVMQPIETVEREATLNEMATSTTAMNGVETTAEIVELVKVIELSKSEEEISNELLTNPSTEHKSSESSQASTPYSCLSRSSSVSSLNWIFEESAEAIVATNKPTELEKAEAITNEYLTKYGNGNEISKTTENGSPYSWLSRTSSLSSVNSNFEEIATANMENTKPIELQNTEEISNESASPCSWLSRTSSLSSVNSNFEESTNEIVEIFKSVKLQKAEEISNELLTTSFIGKKSPEDSQVSSPYTCLSRASSIISLNLIFDESAAIVEINLPIELQKAEEISNELLTTSSKFSENASQCSRLSLTSSLSSLNSIFEENTAEIVKTFKLIELQKTEEICNELLTTTSGGKMPSEVLENSSPCTCLSRSSSMKSLSLVFEEAEMVEIFKPIELQKPEAIPNELLTATSFNGKIASESSPNLAWNSCLSLSSSLFSLNSNFEENTAEIVEIFKSIELQKTEDICNELLTTTSGGKISSEFLENSSPYSCLSRSSSMMSLSSAFAENTAAIVEITKPIELQKPEDIPIELSTTSFIGKITSESSQNVAWNSCLSLSSSQISINSLFKESTTENLDTFKSIELQKTEDICNELLTTTSGGNISSEFLENSSPYSCLSRSSSMMSLNSAFAENTAAIVEITKPIELQNSCLSLSSSMISINSIFDESAAEIVDIFKSKDLQNAEELSNELLTNTFNGKLSAGTSQNSSPYSCFSLSTSQYSLNSNFEGNVVENRNETKLIACSTTDEDSGVMDDHDDTVSSMEFASYTKRTTTKSQSPLCFKAIPLAIQREVNVSPRPRRCYSTTQLLNINRDCTTDFVNVPATTSITSSADDDDKKPDCIGSAKCECSDIHFQCMCDVKENPIIDLGEHTNSNSRNQLLKEIVRPCDNCPQKYLPVISDAEHTFLRYSGAQLFKMHQS